MSVFLNPQDNFACDVVLKGERCICLPHGDLEYYAKREAVNLSTLTNYNPSFPQDINLAGLTQKDFHERLKSAYTNFQEFLQNSKR